MSSQESQVYLFVFHAIHWFHGRGSLGLLVLTSCPYVGLGQVRTPVEVFLVPDVSFVSLFWILGFVLAIASAPCDFLYLNNEYMI